jgi:phospholipase C
MAAGLAAVDHLVVLVLENRSFDNLFGYLYELDRPARFLGRGEPAFRGVAGREDLWNDDGGSPPTRIPVAKAAWQTPADMCQPSPDPGEYYRPHVNRQLYGQDVVEGDAALLPDPAPMSGFVQDYIRAIGQQELWDGLAADPAHFSRIMHCFPPVAVPVLSGLARAYAISDEWHASVPTQTWPNRSFLHSAQSHGFVTNADFLKWHRNTAPTVFERLGEALGSAQGWRVYWDHQDLAALTRFIHPRLRQPQHDANFSPFVQFAADCAAGSLPAYSFIQPRLIINHNDMHPPVIPNQRVHSSVLAGEVLVREIYDAVRLGPLWDRTLLLITFDEHGGCYDHCPPPRAVPPLANPDYPLQDGFGFNRFGVRVPALFISPRVEPGTVVRAMGDAPFDHTSVIRSICERWNLEGLTDRDRAAPDFGHVLTLPEAKARRLTPAFTPRPYQPLTAAEAHESLLSGMQHGLGHLIADSLGRVLPAGLTKVGELLDQLTHR